MDDIQFQIAFRNPIYPLIVISAEGIYSAFNIEELASHCVNGTIVDDEKYIRAIDSRAEEFWYIPEHFTITPGFLTKKWPKKKIIELYNNSQHNHEDVKTYSLKSISAKRVETIVADICELMK